MYSYNPYYERYLAHHGIKNQKWGVRHGPPYPLDKKVSGRIKNPNKYKYKVGAVFMTPKHPNGGYYSNEYWVNNPNTKSGLANKFDRAIRQVQFSSRGEDGVKVHKSISNIVDKYGVEKVSKIFKNFRKDPEELLKSNVNPDYGDNGTTNNCTKCTAALALSAMGFNVEAGRSQHGRWTGEADKWFTGAKTNTSTYDDSARYLDSLDNGSFGEIEIKRSSGSGHSMFWKKDSDGSVYIKDGQTNKVYRNSSTKELLNYIKDYQCSDVDSVNITPLNNTTPNWAAMDLDSVVSARTIGSNFANKNLDVKDSNKWIQTQNVMDSNRDLFDVY